VRVPVLAGSFGVGFGRAVRVRVAIGDYASIPIVETPDPGITFSAFIMSLATTAAVHFGDIADPSSGNRAEPNLAAAAQMIEIIAMLQEKTKGNLIEPEARLVDDLLYELRVRYVQAKEGDKRIVEP
jgi:Domain of unknown function (DUF1844)